MSDHIQTLMDVTGLDREAAQRVLSVNNNNLEHAINFHLEGNVIDGPPPAVVDDDDDTNNETASRSGGAGSGGSAAVDPSMPYLEGGGGVDEDGVRAPIPVRREQMVQPENDQFRMRVRRPFATALGAHNVCPLRNFQLEGELQEAELSEVYQAAAAAGVPMSGAPTAPVRAQHVHGASASVAIPAALHSQRPVALSRSGSMLAAARAFDVAALRARPKRSRLGDLFRPPVELSIVGSLQMVKDCARARNRWVIVNLQDNADFASQVMNRDVWSDAKLRELIKKYFVFWQIAVDTPEGARFRSFYGARQLPYVCLIDPQTGEEKINYRSKDTSAAASATAGPSGSQASRTGPSTSASFRLTAVEFTAELHGFLIEQGVSPDASGPSDIDAAHLQADGLASVTSSAPVDAKPSAQVQRELNEDEQMRLAIENSLRESQQNGEAAGASTSRSPSSSPAGPARKVAKLSVVTDDEDDDDDMHTFNEAAAADVVSTTGQRSSVPLAAAVVEEALPYTPVVMPSQYARYLGDSSDPLTKLQLRLPDGRRENLEWPCSSHIRALRLYVEHVYPEVTRLPYKLLCPFPRMDLLELDGDQTLLGAKLHPSVLLHVHQDD